MNQSSNDTTLAVSPSAPPSRPSWQSDTLALIQALAPSFHQARWFGLSSPEQAIVLMAKAVDLGLPPTSAFEYFEIIENRPAIKPIGAAALMHRSGLIDWTVEDGPDYCRISGRRRDTGFEHTVTYTLDEARAAGLVKADKAGSAWVRFQTDMLYNRAMGRFARRVAPDVLGGLYLSTELISVSPAPAAVVDCDHMAAVASDVACPTCGVVLTTEAEVIA